jgi:hypothetical protein
VRCVSVYCLYTRTIYYYYCCVRPHISYLICFLCAVSCVAGPFFDVKIVVESFSTVYKPHTSWGHFPLTYIVLATFSLFSVALLIRIFIAVAVCIVWSVLSCYVCDVLASGWNAMLRCYLRLWSKLCSFLRLLHYAEDTAFTVWHEL